MKTVTTEVTKKEVTHSVNISMITVPSTSKANSDIKCNLKL